MTNSYVIEMARKEEIEKTLAKYARKAAKYGIPLTVTFGDPRAEKINVYRNDYEAQRCEKVGSEMVEVVDMTIESEPIKANGWTVLARLEHCSGGNIVKTFDVDMEEDWATMKAHCDHCGGNHGQKVTFIVRHEDGTRRQVGRTCLKEYTGINPQDVGFFNEIHDILLDEDVRYDHDFRGTPIVYDTVEMIAYAIKAYKEQGYVKSGSTGSNKDRIGKMLIHHEAITDAEMAEAVKMADEIKAMSVNESIDAMLTNVRTMAIGGYCKDNAFGYIAFAPMALEKFHEKKAADEARRAELEAQAKNSDYVGNVGERIVIDVASMKLVTSFETEWGYTYLYKFVDKSGNVFVWFSSGTFGYWKTENDWVQYETVDKIKGTVKGHSERDGVKQTVLTRVKAA